ncbi:MAG TPA: hypothetical protein VFS67_20595 [Polyangiaceae bacterium]|jgi:hypothetical protein|nr:hypothetical protein [Polyangiaceae bacterium]
MKRALLGLLAVIACADPEPLPFVAHFNVTADEKAPVAGAQIAARGKVIGTTSATGELQVRLHGFEGDRVPITLTCPGGYAPSPAESVIILRSVQGLGGEERKPIDHALGCQPTKRDAVVLVHVSGATASLPVKIDGTPVGQTDGLGFAHFYLRPDPGSRFEVAIDTSSNEKLMPQNPQQVFQVDTHDEVFVFDREFKLPPKPKPVRKRAKPKPQVHIPIRLN